MSTKIKEALEKLRKVGERLRNSSLALQTSVTVLTETQQILNKASAKLKQAADKLLAVDVVAQGNVIKLGAWHVYYTAKSDLVTLQNQNTLQVYVNLRFNIERATFEDERAPEVSWTERRIIAQAIEDLRNSGSKERAN